MDDRRHRVNDIALRINDHNHRLEWQFVAHGKPMLIVRHDCKCETVLHLVTDGIYPIPEDDDDSCRCRVSGVQGL